MVKTVIASISPGTPSSSAGEQAVPATPSLVRSKSLPGTGALPATLQRRLSAPAGVVRETFRRTMNSPPSDAQNVPQHPVPPTSPERGALVNGERLVTKAHDPSPAGQADNKQQLQLFASAQYQQQRLSVARERLRVYTMGAKAAVDLTKN